MKIVYNTSKRKMMLKITVKTDSPQKIHMIVKDANRPNTYYTNRFNTVRGIENFFIRLPQSPKTAIIIIFNDRTKNNEGFSLKPYKNTTGDVLPFEILPLNTQISAFDFSNQKLASFLAFAQDFCDKAGYLSTGYYLSPDGIYHIKYDDIIRSIATGKELNTPARINSKTGLIQISKSAFSKYTIPGRFAILLHEFAHFYSNKDMKDEIEADFHAATIYLGLGYPRVEILNVFANVFDGADHEYNRLRFDKMKEFIMSFDDKMLSVSYS